MPNFLRKILFVMLCLYNLQCALNKRCGSTSSMNSRGLRSKRSRGALESKKGVKKALVIVLFILAIVISSLVIAKFPV